MDGFDLLIVGGGLAGASLGRAMALSGFRVLIVEKELNFRFGPAAEFSLMRRYRVSLARRRSRLRDHRVRG